ncbi:MAG: ornithine carbamoyltransferase [Verrucomicrobiota bacterium]
MKHLLSIEELSAEEMIDLVDLGVELKKSRHDRRPLAGQSWALIFSKSSTRTRVSFEVGVRELGGTAIFFSADDLQLGRGEPMEDTARVMGRMLHGAIIRTYGQDEVVAFAHHSGIPTINALTDAEHPCQILADLLTIKEKLGTWEGKKIVFVGDATSNMAKSWMWAADKLPFELILAAPEAYQPSRTELEPFKSGRVHCESDCLKAGEHADVLYTDVWVSMGQEEESADRLNAMTSYQINDELLAVANPGALVLHCLPAYREKEITEAVLEAHATTIFDQAENRLHAQKAVLVRLAEAQASS